MFLTFFIAFASLVSLMVIHEFGHFILAKKFGADVEEFGIGYPPRIIGKKIKGVVYSLNLIPFGAFVSIRGEKGGVEDLGSFSGKPIWQRMSIVLGGVVSFWIVAAILLSIVSGVWGLPTAVSDNETGHLVSPKVKITYLFPDSPATQAGLQLGDTILGFNKISDLQAFVDSHKGQQITLNIERGNKTLQETLTPRVSPPANEGAIGIGLTRIALKVYPWYQAPVEGVVSTWYLTVNIVSGWVIGIKHMLGMVQLPTGVNMELMGPVGIFSLLGEYFSMGMNYFLYLVALIAVALALANALPIPALDGGKVLFLAIEAVRGKPINPKIEQKLSGIFFVLLIILMIFVTVKFDIPRLF